MSEIKEKATCAVIGYGSWATAIVKILLENESKVSWHINRQDVIKSLQNSGNNPRYLPDIQFPPEKLELFSDINQAVSKADILILAVPSAFLIQALEALSVSISDKFIVSAIKGIIPDDYITVAEYVNRKYSVPFDNIGILAGPCHSEEVALERLSYLSFACKNIRNAEILCRKFSTSYIQTNPSVDIYGVEYGAVLKNIYAIGSGIAIGLGYGDNFLSVLISNAAIEMNRFLNESYPAERDTSSSAYLGDLIVTSYSEFSRNRRFGVMIGNGYSINSAIAELNMIAEGYYASECIAQINKRFGIEMPIAECVHRILYEGKNPASEIKRMSEKLI